MLKRSRGFGLVEAMVAGAILLIIGLVVVQFLTGTQKTSLIIEGNSECQSRAQQVVAKFSNFNNSLSVSNWHPISGETVPARSLFPNVQDHWERFWATELWRNPISPSNVNSWLMVNASVNWALYLYNLGPAISYCATTKGSYGQALTPASIYYDPPVLKNEVHYLNIQKTLANGDSNCDELGTLQIPPNSGLGLKVTSTVQYTDTSGAQKICQAQVLLKHDQDKTPPTLSSQQIGPCAGPGVCIQNALAGPSGSQIYCAGETPYASVSAGERGVFFLCKLEYRDSLSFPAPTPMPSTPSLADWSLCSQFDAAGGTGSGHVVKTTGRNADTFGANARVTSVSLAFSNLSEGWYRLSVIAVDSGQNITSMGSGIFGVDLNGPMAVAAPTPPAPFISRFNTQTNSEGHTNSTAEWGYDANMFGTTYFQCLADPTGATPRWTSAPIETIEVSPHTTQWQFETSTGTVVRAWSLSSTSPSGLTNGNYQAKYRVRDACHTYSTSPTTPWTADLGPAPVATIQTTAGKVSIDKPNPVRFNFLAAKSGAGAGPYRYTCEAGDGSQSSTAVALTCNPTNFPFSAQPCVARNQNLCTKAFDGCGRTDVSPIVQYEVRGNVGDSCREVPCRSPLICTRDQVPDSNNGICQDPGNEAWPPYSPAGSPGDCIEDSHCVTNFGTWNCSGAQVSCRDTSTAPDTWNNAACADTAAAVGTSCNFVLAMVTHNGTCVVRNYGSCNVPTAQGPIGPTPPTNATCPAMATACGGAAPFPSGAPTATPTATPSPTPTATPAPSPSASPCPDPATVCPGDEAPGCPEGERTGCTLEHCTWPNKTRNHASCVAACGDNCNRIWNYTDPLGNDHSCYKCMPCTPPRVWPPNLGGSCVNQPFCVLSGQCYEWINGGCYQPLPTNCTDPSTFCPSVSPNPANNQCGQACPTGTKITGCGGGGGHGCFAAGTQVATPQGTQSIESIRVGQYVLAYDLTLMKVVPARVRQVFVHNDKSFGILKTNNGRTFKVTSVHRFYLPELKTWLAASELKPGMKFLVVSQGQKDFDEFKSYVELKQNKSTVYNFEVEQFHNYFVDGVLVHNTKCPLEPGC